MADACKALVSVIMPAYNAGAFIAAAIQSLISQTWQNWELLVVNDGSTDDTEEVVVSFKDVRIRYYHQKNGGVSAARNLALRHMKGDFFCFLDADDIFPLDSIAIRLKYMLRHPEVDVLDTAVAVKDEQLNQVIRMYVPDFKGIWWPELIKLKGNCFFGINVFFRKRYGVLPQPHGATHGEDFIFYLHNAHQHQLVYHALNYVCYVYRRPHHSAMTNLKGLESGYDRIVNEVNNLSGISALKKLRLRMRVFRILFLSYVRAGELRNAVLQWVKLFR